MFNQLFIIWSLIKISIYSFNITTIDGTNVNLSQFQGKKMLIVNTASNSRFVAQYASLEQLQEKFKSGLVVIAFPSNDFNKESGTVSQIRSMIRSKYNASYMVAAVQSVTGSASSSLFKWLSTSSQNGSVDIAPAEDFCKYLVDETGNIIGVFAGAVDPMDSVIQNAITN